MTEFLPKEAHEKMCHEGYTYLDVRTEEEFAAGHPAGAWNIPVVFRGPEGMAANSDFEAVTAKHFAPDTKLLVGCAAGGRSMMAIQRLEAAGFTQLANVACGFGGNPHTGEPGWQASGLPVSQTPETGRSYGELKG